eukprot:scaffold33761_cov112-Isochrysis_galbana.AAC.1
MRWVGLVPLLPAHLQKVGVLGKPAYHRHAPPACVRSCVHSPLACLCMCGAGAPGGRAGSCGSSEPSAAGALSSSWPIHPPTRLTTSPSYAGCSSSKCPTPGTMTTSLSPATRPTYLESVAGAVNSSFAPIKKSLGCGQPYSGR